MVVVGKKGSLTSHESSECPSTTPGPPAALHVTAPTPSDSETGTPGHFLAVYSKCQAVPWNCAVQRESKSVVNILTLQVRPPVSGTAGRPSTLLAQHLPPPGRPSSTTSRRSSSWRSRGCGTGGVTLGPVPPPTFTSHFQAAYFGVGKHEAVCHHQQHQQAGRHQAQRDRAATGGGLQPGGRLLGGGGRKESRIFHLE